MSTSKIIQQQQQQQQQQQRQQQQKSGAVLLYRSLARTLQLKVLELSLAL